MAQKLNLDFSIGESIVNGIKGTSEVETGSVSINITDVSLVGKTYALLGTSNTTLELANRNVESVGRNYESALKSFEELQDKSLNGVITNTANSVKEGFRNSLAGVKK